MNTDGVGEVGRGGESSRWKKQHNKGLKTVWHLPGSAERAMAKTCLGRRFNATGRKGRPTNVCWLTVVCQSHFHKFS